MAHGLSPATRDPQLGDGRISTGYLPPETARLRLHLLPPKYPASIAVHPARAACDSVPCPSSLSSSHTVRLVSGFGPPGFLVLMLHLGWACGLVAAGTSGGRGRQRVARGEEKRLSRCGSREKAGWTGLASAKLQRRDLLLFQVDADQGAEAAFSPVFFCFSAFSFCHREVLTSAL